MGPQQKFQEVENEMRCDGRKARDELGLKWQILQACCNDSGFRRYQYLLTGRIVLQYPALLRNNPGLASYPFRSSRLCNLSPSEIE